MPKGAKRYGLKLTDWETGKKVEGVFIPYPEGEGGRWMKLFQDALLGLAQSDQLHGQSLRVLWWLFSVTKWRNRLPGTAITARALGLHQSSASRAYKELKHAGCIYEQEGVYILSPRIGWKGNNQDLDEAYKELFASETKALPPATIRETRAIYGRKR